MPPSWLAALCLFVVGLFVAFYHPALRTYFSQEDFALLVGTRPGWTTWTNLFTTGGGPFYRPLTQQVYYHLNQLVWDLDPMGHYLSNLVVHAVNTLLVALLALRWWSPLGAATSAVLFSLHASHYYEVFWVAGISQSGYMLFLLLTLFLLSRYLSSERVVYLSGSWLASLGAFLSKEDAMTLPVIVMLFVLMEGRRRIAFCAAYWAVGGAVLAWRLYLFGWNLPRPGVYSLGFSWGDPGQDTTLW